MLLKDFKDVLIEYNGKGTAGFREDWNEVLSCAWDKDRDTVLTRSYSGAQYTNLKTSLESLLKAMEGAATQAPYTQSFRLDVMVKRTFTKEALSKPLSKVVNVHAFNSRFVRLLTDEVRNEFFEPKTDHNTRWVAKKKS